MTSSSLVFNRTAEDILLYIHYASPVLLLAFFLIAFTAHSIATASKDSTIAVSPDQTGPGGKPLPKGKGPGAQAQQRKQILDFSPARKLLFVWISAGAILTFVANAAVVISHALVDRKDSWWCGQHVAVRSVSAAPSFVRLADQEHH